MNTQPSERDILVEFERTNLPQHYKEFYANKRHNLLASIQRFPRIWEAFMRMDKIWMREFEDMRETTNINKMFPLVLYLNAHVKMRIGMELGLSTCLPEAHSMLRDAIESVAHAHRLVSNPHLVRVWLDRATSDTGRVAFDEQFWHYKKDRLFEGLDELFEQWKTFSNFGSHTNADSIAIASCLQATRPQSRPL
jgi:hypothetical protein